MISTSSLFLNSCENKKKKDDVKASAGLVQDGGYRLVMVMAIMMLNEEKIDTYDWPLQLGAQGLL